MKNILKTYLSKICRWEWVHAIRIIRLVQRKMMSTRMSEERNWNDNISNNVANSSLFISITFEETEVQKIDKEKKKRGGTIRKSYKRNIWIQQQNNKPFQFQRGNIHSGRQHYHYRYYFHLRCRCSCS